MNKVEEYFNKKGIDTNDIVCYSTPNGTAEPIDFCPMEFAEAYLKHKVNAISDDEIDIGWEKQGYKPYSSSANAFIKGAKEIKQLLKQKQ